jgi:hypothetical protein
VAVIFLVAFCNAFQDMASNLPYLPFGEVRLLFDISFANVIGEVHIAVLHEDAILVELGIDLEFVPVIKDFDDVRTIRHADGRDRIDFTPHQSAFCKVDDLQGVNLERQHGLKGPGDDTVGLLKTGLYLT